MKIGFMGLGKLGLPVALAMESRGHEVAGWDPSTSVQETLESRVLPYREEQADALLAKTEITIKTSIVLAEWADIVFVAAQTPHDPEYEGVTPLPMERKDFDYSYLQKAIEDIAALADIRRPKSVEPLLVAVISTVLPGTIEKIVAPLGQENWRLVYNPFFIAMGTTIHDFLHPEFVLLGSESDTAAAQLTEFYSTIHDKPVRRMSIRSAELAKVGYNTFIGMKVVWANTMMELADRTGANCDDITDALSLATDRIVSPAYMHGGMGDGGGCHPRDNIALSYLAREVGLSYDIFSSIMHCREEQSMWLARVIRDWHEGEELEVILMGAAYKKGTNLTNGSPALLLSHQLRQIGVPHQIYDPYVNPEQGRPSFEKALYFISTNHDDWGGGRYQWPNGSVVLDPWGYVLPQDGVSIVPLGRHH